MGADTEYDSPSFERMESSWLIGLLSKRRDRNNCTTESARPENVKIRGLLFSSGHDFFLRKCPFTTPPFKHNLRRLPLVPLKATYIFRRSLGHRDVANPLRLSTPPIIPTNIRILLRSINMDAPE